MNKERFINTVKGFAKDTNEYPELGLFYHMEKCSPVGLFLGYKKGKDVEVLRDVESAPFKCCPVILAAEYKMWLKEALEESKKDSWEYVLKLIREESQKRHAQLSMDIYNLNYGIPLFFIGIDLASPEVSNN